MISNLSEVAFEREKKHQELEPKELVNERQVGDSHELEVKHEAIALARSTDGQKLRELQKFEVSRLMDETSLRSTEFTCCVTENVQNNTFKSRTRSGHAEVHFDSGKTQCRATCDKFQNVSSVREDVLTPPHNLQAEAHDGPSGSTASAWLGDTWSSFSLHF